MTQWLTYKVTTRAASTSKNPIFSYPLLDFLFELSREWNGASQTQACITPTLFQSLAAEKHQTNCGVPDFNHTLPYHTIQYYSIPYHTIPYHTIPHHTTLYHTTPYHTMRQLPCKKLPPSRTSPGPPELAGTKEPLISPRTPEGVWNSAVSHSVPRGERARQLLFWFPLVISNDFWAMINKKHKKHI